MWKKVARAGWVARGISYSVAGLIALSLAHGSRIESEDADQKGALAAISEAPLGAYLLAALALGLALFTIWQGAQLPQLKGTEFNTWLERVAKVIGVFFYGSLAFTAGRLSLTGGDSGSSRRWTVERLLSWAMQHPVGRIATVVAALVVAAIAVRRGSRTVTGDLDDDLNFENASELEHRFVKTLGRLGEIGRAFSFLIVSWFLVQAAWSANSGEGGGLDSSLVEAAGTTFGAALVATTGVGFVLFGLYSVFSARHRRLDLDDAE